MSRVCPGPPGDVLHSSQYLYLELIGGSGRTAGRYASAARAFFGFSPTSALIEQARGGGEALWERVEAGSASLGAASSESAAGSGRLRACGCSCRC